MLHVTNRGQSPLPCSVLADLLVGVLAGPGGAGEEEDVSEVGELVIAASRTAAGVLVDDLVLVVEHVRTELGGDDRDATRRLLADDREARNEDLHD